MAYTSPTVADMKLFYPRFAAVNDAIIADALAQAAAMVDMTWAEIDFTTAQRLYAAHVLTIGGFGTGQEAVGYANGMGVFQSIRTGSLSLNKGSRADAGTEAMGEFGRTTFGQSYWALLMRNKAGARVVVPGYRGPSGYAKDAPL